jgi:threonylcarbamoyladenosine tRNA methylthiotransferase MtaB
MCRCYTRDDFAQAVFLIRSKVPGVALSTDVIVGFPGESDEEFLESYEFCQAMEFDRMHVFPFSPRPGTAAGAMGGKVDERTKKERAGLMLELARRMRRKSMSKSIGQICRVLVEQKRGEWWSGLSDNYFRVYFNSDSANLTNQVIKLKIVRLLGDGLWGEVLPGES